MTHINDSHHTQTELFANMTEGLNAITVQPYTEVNSKFGVQWELGFFASGIAANGGVSYITIETGSKFLLVKDIQAVFNSARISTQLFKNPTFTGGTPIPYYNMRDDSPVAGEVVFKGNPTVTNDGTPVSPQIVGIGTVAQGSRTISAVSKGSGVERILLPNSTYVYKTVNLDTTNAAAISGVVTWYEGGTDYSPE